MISSRCNVYIISDDGTWHSWPLISGCWVSGSLAHTVQGLCSHHCLCPAPAWASHGRVASSDQSSAHTDIISPPGPGSASFTQFYQFFHRSTLDARNEKTQRGVTGYTSVFTNLHNSREYWAVRQWQTFKIDGSGWPCNISYRERVLCYWLGSWFPKLLLMI